MKEIIYIFIGGGMGSVTRYLTQIAVNERLSPALFPFPWGTFAVNIIGSLLIGFFYSFSERFNLSFELRLFLTVGFCGGFTTFSTLTNDSLSLLKGVFMAYSPFMYSSAYCLDFWLYWPEDILANNLNNKRIIYEANNQKSATRQSRSSVP